MSKVDDFDTHFAPDMRRMFINKSLRRIAKQEFRYDQQTNVFLAIECLLKDMTSIAVHCEFHNATPVETREVVGMPLIKEYYRPHARHNLTPFIGSRRSLQTPLHSPVAKAIEGQSGEKGPSIARPTDGPSSRNHERI